MSTQTGQLFFRIAQGNDTQLGAIDNTGAMATQNSIYFGGGYNSGTPQNPSFFGNETSVAVDTAAGLVFSVGTGNTGSFNGVSVHDLNTGALIETITFGTFDVVQALALDPFTNTLYVGDWGNDFDTTGVAAFTYDPATGFLTPNTTGSSATTITTTIGATSTTSTAAGIYLFTESQVPEYTNANAFYLDSANGLLYYVNDDSGYNFSPFSPTNGVYVVNTNGPTFTATQLTSQTQFPTADQTQSGHDQFIGPNGNIVGLAVDVADGVVFFETTDNEGSPNIALWWVDTTGANQTATQIVLPAGVSLDFAGQTNEGGAAAGLTFDPSTKQLYLTDVDNDPTVRNTGAIYQLQWDPVTHTVTLVNTYDTARLVGATPATVDSFDAPATTTFDVLPTLITSGTANQATEQSAAVTLLSATPTVTDPDGNHLAGASVQITGGTFASNESSAADDHLSVNGASSGVVAGTNITISYSSATETLTLTGYDTLSNYQTVLSQVQYDTTGDNPTNYGSNTTRAITWQVDDGAIGNPAGANNVATTTLTVVGVDDAPTLAGTANASFTENGPAVTLSPSVTVTDPDSLNLAGATVALTGGTFAGDGDVLAASTAGTAITASYNAATETLTLTGSDTLAHYQQVLDSVTFVTASENPDNGGADPTRTVTWTLNDGGAASSVTTTVSITALNDAPTLAGTTDASFTENGPAVTLSGAASVTDPDNATLANATVKITGGTFAGDGDVLAANISGTSITASYNAATETLVLSGSDTLAHYQQVLDSVTFVTASENPDNGGAAPTRTVTWTLNDGGAASTVTTAVSITAVNDAPTLAGTTNASFTENGPAVTLSGAASVTDPDSATLAGATVAITGGTFAGDGDVLAANTTGTAITASYNAATETLVLSGSDTLAHYQQVLDSVTFVTASEDPDNGGANPSRTVTWTLDDGSASNATTSVTTTIGITAANDAPAVSAAASASYTEQAAATTLSGGLAIADPDSSTLAGATVKITGGTFAGDGDVLGFSTAGTSISASYNAATETLVLSGVDTVAHYQSVLDSVTFFDANDNPTNYGSNTTRVVTWVVTDGSASSNVATTTLSVTAVNDAPTLAGVPATAAYTFGQTLTVAPSVSAADPDNLTLANATVQVTAGAFAGDGDVLAANTAGTSISASYNAATETLTLSGSDTLAHYQQVLDSVTFTSGSNPTNAGLNPTRTLSWTINDGSGSNNTATATTTISITGHAVKNDFNGDRTADILFQASLGPLHDGLLLYFMNSTTVTSQASLTGPGITWSVVGSGDFNGDGKADILFQNFDGTPQIWTMNGSTITSSTTLSNPGITWDAIGTGDFNGDGKADILFQNANGTPQIWLMNGTSVVSTATLSNPGIQYDAIGTGDFNGDGKADIVFQKNSGTPLIWEMNGTSVIATATLANPGAQWKMVGTGDFNGDGNDDLLFQKGNGTPLIWEMNGTSVIATATLANPGSAWDAIGTGDYNGDGKADILFQKNDGTPMIWTMNGTSVTASATLPNPGILFHANTG